MVSKEVSADFQISMMVSMDWSFLKIARELHVWNSMTISRLVPNSICYFYFVFIFMQIANYCKHRSIGFIADCQINMEFPTDCQISTEFLAYCQINTVDSRYLKIEGTSKTLRDICTSTYQICSIEGKTI